MPGRQPEPDEQVSDAQPETPPHASGIAPDEHAPANGLGYYEGHVVRYVTSYQLGGTPIEDLKRARDYLDTLIRHLETKGIR